MNNFFWVLKFNKENKSGFICIHEDEQYPYLINSFEKGCVFFDDMLMAMAILEAKLENNNLNISINKVYIDSSDTEVEEYKEYPIIEPMYATYKNEACTLLNHKELDDNSIDVFIILCKGKFLKVKKDELSNIYY